MRILQPNESQKSVTHYQNDYRYDIVGSSDDDTTHQEIIKLARSIPVQVITAHVVKGQLVLVLAELANGTQLYIIP